MSFHVNNLYDKVQSDIVIRSNHIHQFDVVLKFRYFRHFFIIKYWGLEPIIFTINLDIASSSKVFSTFDYVFLYLIELLTKYFYSLKKSKLYHCYTNKYSLKLFF